MDDVPLYVCLHDYEKLRKAFDDMKKEKEKLELDIERLKYNEDVLHTLLRERKYTETK